jgi:hypothetical protein
MIQAAVKAAAVVSAAAVAATTRAGCTFIEFEIVCTTPLCWWVKTLTCCLPLLAILPSGVPSAHQFFRFEGLTYFKTAVCETREVQSKL